jgi:hypothetical protein
MVPSTTCTTPQIYVVTNLLHFLCTKCDSWDFITKSYDSWNHVYYVRINIIYRLEIQSDQQQQKNTK